MGGGLQAGPTTPYGRHERSVGRSFRDRLTWGISPGRIGRARARCPTVEPKERLGQNLSQLRGRAGLTQMELANRARMDMAEISRLERGKRDPRLSTVVRLAVALELPLDELLRGIPTSG